MLEIPDNVRESLITLVPLAVFNEMSCFVYYDNHPKNDIHIDVIICTNSGEVKEYFEREVVLQMNLDCNSIPSEIKIIRNSVCNLFYIVVSIDIITILSRKDDGLIIHRVVKNVQSYDVEDSCFIGQACLKIVCKDDAVPLIFDDNFEILGDQALVRSGINSEDTSPLVTDLHRKLIEVKHIVNSNENAYKEFLSLRQMSALKIYQKCNPNFNDSIFKNNTRDMAGAFMVKTFTPLIKMCNKKLTIILNIVNDNDVPMEDVHVLLHTNHKLSLVYTTKIYEKEKCEPFWYRCNLSCIKKNIEYAVVAIVDLVELKNSISSRIDFTAVLVYKRQGNIHLLPFENVSVSALDTMGEQFDVLCAKNPIDVYTILSLLATTEMHELNLRHIRINNDPELNMIDTFCTYLGMDKVDIAPNTVLHRSSPYHILHSVMVILEQHENKDDYYLKVYTRLPDQIIALIHLIHDAVPHKLIVTTYEHKLIAKKEELSRYNEVATGEGQVKIGHLDYAMALTGQATMLLEHLQDCVTKMNESKLPEVQQRIGQDIDILAAGFTRFLKLRENLFLNEVRGIRFLRNRALTVSNFDNMIYDDDLSSISSSSVLN